MMNKITRFMLLLAVLVMTAQTMLATAPTNYYSSAYGKSNEQLMIAMRNIIAKNHNALSYDALWNAFKTTDTDDQGYIIDMYSNCKYRPNDHGGSAQNVGDGFNREHSFPKSWFDDGKPMYTDLFHLYPTDIKVNGQRSNYPFGECAGGTRLTNGQWYGKGKLGSSTFPGYSGKVFEPDDEYKGDFARTYFYMVTRYKNELPNWSGSAQLDYITNRYKAFSTWTINMLLKWARQDPVSEKETKRNDAVFSIQGNRNPFIDNPELFEYIWGDKQGEAWNGGGGGDPVPTITSPHNGSIIDMGNTTIGTELPYTISLEGKELSDEISLSMSDETNFDVSDNSFSARDVNNGTQFTIIFKALEEGRFENSITLSSNEVSTTFTVIATATKSGDTPPPAVGDSIVEDWEGCQTGGYWTKEVQGHAWTWKFEDAGIWSDNFSRDQLSCRLGKTSSSSITMAEDVAGGIGVISFWACNYGNDTNATLRVDYSTDKGSTWNLVDVVTTSSGPMNYYLLNVGVDDPVRFRIVQTAGMRVNIDDFTVYKLIYQPTNKYDVNGDGVVNILDVNYVIELIFRGVFDGATPIPGDVNGDNTVNIADVNAIINWILTH